MQISHRSLCMVGLPLCGCSSFLSPFVPPSTFYSATRLSSIAFSFSFVYLYVALRIFLSLSLYLCISLSSLLSISICLSTLLYISPYLLLFPPYTLKTSKPEVRLNYSCLESIWMVINLLARISGLPQRNEDQLPPLGQLAVREMRVRCSEEKQILKSHL